MTRSPPMSLTALEDRATPAAAGTLDPAFGVGGLAKFASPAGATGFTPAAVAAYPDGRYVVSGASVAGRSPGGDANYLARYTAAGRLDTSFGAAGFVTLPDGVGSPTALAVDPAGRVLYNSAVASSGLTVRRVTADGRQDTGFGANGVATIPAAPAATQSDAVGAFAFQPDGRIVVAGGAYAGSTTESFSVITTFKSDAVVVRLTAAGQLDSTFGTGGRVSLSTPDFNDAATGVQALADGRVLVVGDFSQSQKPFATRLAADGSVDATYGAGGQADVSGQSAVVALADGRVLRAATAFPFSPGLPTRPATTLARLTAVGQPEPGFNTAANDSVGFDALSPGRAVALPDGGLLLRAGVQSKSDPTQSDQGVVRFVGTTTPSPSPAGTLNVGGAPAGGVTPLRPDAGGAFSPLAALNVYPNSSGAVRTATADVNGDGVPDLVTGVGPGGGSGVVVTDGKTGARLADFSAFEATFTGGVFVAAADLDRDGFAEVVVTPDRGGGPVVAIYDGAGLAAGKNAAAELTRFFGIDDNAFRGGARPALGDVNGDGRPRAADGSARLVTGSGEGQPGRVNVCRAATAIAGGPADQVVSPFGDAALADGVYVG